MQIEQDMIVRNKINGRTYRVRSVTLTHAICWPCGPKGGKPAVGFRATAIKFAKDALEPVK